MNKCIGCGDILDSNNNLCERCFRIRNYNEYKHVFKDNFDYSSIESGVLPKLKDTEGKLLPNQQDYKYKKELLKVKSIETNQDMD